MMSMRLPAVLCLTLLAAALFPASAFAGWPPLQNIPQVEPVGTPDVAVIVGVEDYLLLPDVPGAVENLNDWEVFLRQGLQVPTVHVLANRDVTRESMLKFARTAAEDVGEGGTIWWVFIGHGAPSTDGKDGLLVGVDAQQSVESLAARGLSQRELLAALGAERHRAVLLLDACFSGRASDGSALATGVQPVVPVRPTGQLGDDTVVVSASKATEVAGQLDGTPRPAFSYLMLGAMRGWADDGDGVVTVEEALHFARRKLRGVKGRQQTPQAAGNVELVLSRGVTERKPLEVVAAGDPTTCAEGQTLRDGECVALEDVPASSEQPSEAERTLDYLKRRIVYDGRIARQGGRILEGPAYYHAIDRPDLAAKWKSHIPALWISGIAVTAGGLFLLSYGIAKASDDTISRDAQTGWFIGGSLGGFFSLAGGVCMITFGFIADQEPMSFAERKSAAEAFNRKLREERDLSPEVDWQNQPSRRGPLGRGPLGRARFVGVTLRF
jgi:hypothetical protein